MNMVSANKLRKLILFKYVKLSGHDMCFRCGEKITEVRQFSIDHKLPWRGIDEKLFWNLDNISFSHLSCNSRAGRRKIGVRHPSQESYKRGCRCGECRIIQRDRIRKQRVGNR